MKIVPISLLLILTLFHGSVLADWPLAEALAEAKGEISETNPTARLFLPAVTEGAFLSGLEYAIHDFDDLVLVKAEKQGINPKEFDEKWFEIYRPIYQRIQESKKLPGGVKIREMKHIVQISKNSPNRKYCDEGTKHRRGLDLRLHVGKMSEEALGFSMPILVFELGHFSRD